MRVFVNSLVVLVAICVVPAVALGVTTKEWESTGDKDFSKGTRDGVALNSDHELILEPMFDQLETDEVAIWTSVTSSQGVTYFGTGKTGNIYKLVGNKLEKVAENTGFMVTAMAADGNGNIYAASLPGGRITRITPEGKSDVLATLQELYIWALACDSKGNVYAGTGPAGMLYRITPKGNPVVLYDTQADHVFSLAIDAQDNVYFGTADGATLFRIDAAQAGLERVKARVVHDFDGTELKAIQIAGDRVYVAVNKTRENPEVGMASALYDASDDDQDDDGVKAPFSGLGGAVYRINEGKPPEALFKPSSHFILRLKVDAIGDLYMATSGGKGVVRYATKTGTTSLVKVDEKQVLTLDLMNGKLHLIGTSNPGVIYLAKPNAPDAATFTSRVFAPGMPVKWGNVAWDASGPVTLQVRAGNTQKPDETWTDWQAVPNPGATTELGDSGYAQYRVTWSRKAGAKAALHSVTLSYLETNVAPKMGRIKIGSGTVSSKSTRSKSGNGSHSGQAKKISWDATDANKDKLGYRVYYRRSTETNWRLLNPEELITDDEYRLDLDKMVAGEHQIKIEVTDELSNPDGRALSDAEESVSFLLDNTRPNVQVAKAEIVGNQATITGSATDAITAIASIEYALDGGKWKAVFPTDDIFDGKTENFAIAITVNEKGFHGIAIRVVDAQGNTGVGHSTFQIK